METSRLKKFATEARSNLIKGVVDRLKMLGFDENGHVEDSVRPEKLQGGVLFRGKLKQGYDFYNKWVALESTIKNHPKGAKVGIKYVAEEAAYTWFNRFVAIRILQKNRLIEPQLAYAEGGRIPLIVENARQGRLPKLDETERAELDALLDDDSKVLEQFTVLIVAYCHTTPILLNCFGHIDDYTELLLPTNILAAGGFIDLLNTTDYITDKDFKQTELIGWLYQFYISEKKDEVFASFKNKKKAEAEDIPAATQIFTPNWIVKYMVQNTLGRIYLDNNPGSDLAKDWKYLVDTPTTLDSIYRYAELESLKVADFACGSGHILNEFFDMLYSFYMDEGSSPAQAIESIFKNNLIGIDLDTRAKQLSMFSLLLKACQKNAKFVDAKMLPRVISCQTAADEIDEIETVILSGDKESSATISPRVKKELAEAFALVKQAANLGSCIRFKISFETREYLEKQQSCAPIDLILALTDKYSAIAMNPPYMGNGNMNAELSDYVKKEYPKSKADLYSVFIDLVGNNIQCNAKFSMITMHGWMFLSTMNKLRNSILDNLTIDNVIHLGAHTFDELNGEVVQNVLFTCTNNKTNGNKSIYYKLTDLVGCERKEKEFLEIKNKPKGIVKNKVFVISQDVFSKIPGRPIGYWATPKDILLFETNKTIECFADLKKGMDTGNNSLFVRLWYEIAYNKFNENYDSIKRIGKWVPYRKGGLLRKWYGNNDYVLNWENDGEQVCSSPKANIRNKQTFFNSNASWTLLCSKMISVRFYPGGVYDGNAPSLFGKDVPYYIGLLNSVVGKHILGFLSPTLTFNSGDVAKFPVIIKDDKKNEAENTVQSNISISKQDWDAHETSWDFQKNELLAMSLEDEDANVQFDIDEAAKCGKMLCIDRAAPEPESLSWRMRVYQGKWERLFKQLHANEEELNRQFIEIYGLQDELTPDVPLDEVTILQQGEISIGKTADCNMSCNAPLVDYDQIEWHEDVVIKQFISYAIGCMMGRYRLDKPGLAIAHPNATEEETAPYTYNGETFKIDDDGIIPLMSKDSAFSDNAVNRFTDFLRIAFGSEKLTENLNYVEKCLGKSIEDYLYKNFWDDHKKMYQNRPIYWLFSSKKGAFKCIVYMHRMDAYTAELVRKNYLLSHLDYLRKRIAGLEADELNLSSADNRMLKKLRDNYDECLEYDGRLQRVASEQIAFDLDDGVVVNYAKFGDVLAKIK